MTLTLILIPTLPLALTLTHNPNISINPNPNSRYLTLTLLRNAVYETPGYEKATVRNVWHQFRDSEEDFKLMNCISYLF